MIQVNRKFVTLYPRKILEEEDKYDDRWTDIIIHFKEIQKLTIAHIKMMKYIGIMPHRSD